MSTMINTMVLTCILLYGNLQKHDNSLLQALASSPFSFLELVLLLVPYSLSMGLPFGFSLAVLFCIGRWASSREILALRSHGIGIHQWSAGILGLSCLLSILSAFSSLEWGPESRAKFETRKKEILWENLNAVLIDQGYIDLDVNRDESSDSVKSLEGLCEGNVSKISISVTKIQSENWQNVRILMSDRTGQILSVIHAAEAQVRRSKDKENLIMNLYDVDVEPDFPKDEFEKADSSSKFVSFKSWKQPLVVNLYKKNGSNAHDLKRLGFFELLKVANSQERSQVVIKANLILSKNLALGCSPLFLGMLLIPIAAQKGRKESMLNLVLGIFVCLSYFGLGSIAANILGFSNFAYLGWWIPNLCCFVVGLSLFLKFEIKGA